MRTAVALGSNLGNRLDNLRVARKAIVNLAGVGPPVVFSPIYETDPVDCDPHAGAFLNAIIEFDYEDDPVELLKKLREIEKTLGRPLDHVRNTSRKIDIDLLYFGDTKIDNKQLQLPHPRMHLRSFVLQPLCDIQPDLVFSGQTKTVRELLAQVADSGKVFRTEWKLE